MRRLLLFGFIGLLCSRSVLVAGESTRKERAPTGNARIDIVGFLEPGVRGGSLQDAVGEAAVEARKSPWLAAGLSLALPGAGEFYAESYWKSAAFFAVEAAVWIVAYTYDKKADRQTDFFQNYANEHWSVYRYAVYARDNLAPAAGDYSGLIIPGTDGRYPWERVDWVVLNRMERDIGGYYSHTLPRWGEQQYYELIGKYPQFNQGWDDAPPAFNYGDPLTGRFLYYADERGKANRYYETASTMVTIAIVNHILSAIDAAWSAGSYNRGLHAEVIQRTVPTPAGLRAVPMLQVSYRP
ncbi:MAG: hypothetical protein AB1428_10580 [Bacteroidota bacterium]